MNTILLVSECSVYELIYVSFAGIFYVLKDKHYQMTILDSEFMKKSTGILHKTTWDSQFSIISFGKVITA